MKKQEPVSKYTMEKVRLTENLLLCYGSGLEPTEQEVARARELGIDVDGMSEVKGNDEASSY